MKESHVLEDNIKLREELFINLYQQAFPIVARYIGKMGGSLEQTKDVFQDSLIIYYEKFANSSSIPAYGEKAYLIGIAKHLWYKKYRENKESSWEELDFEIEDKESKDISSVKILKFLEIAGQKCMEMLEAFYYQKMSIKDITDRFGFSTERSATVQKYKCLEKVRETIKAKSLVYEDFHE
jgi:DNA-directed RNA polymerase specialized sigma24 family protein